MTASNHPEKPFFDRAVALATEIAERRDDLKAVYESAKEHEAIGKEGVKTLKAAVKRHMEDADKRTNRLAREAEAEALLHRLGHLRGTPLAEAAMARAAG